MERRSLIKAALVAFAAAATRLFPISRSAVAASDSTSGMMGGMDEMMRTDNMAGPMRTGMQLFMRHAEIRRTVTKLPNGVQAVTESHDPETAALIQAHVTEMYQRLDQDRSFPYPMSRSVPAMFEHSTSYHRKLQATPRGVIVTETADDPAMVAVIQLHAREISGFVREGMPAMMRGMMMQ